MIRSLVTRLTILEQLTVIGAIVAFGLTSLLVTSQVLRNDERKFVTSTVTRMAREFDHEFAEIPDTQTVARELIADGTQAGVHVELRDAHGLFASSRGRHTGPEGERPSSQPPLDDGRTATVTSPMGIHVTVVAADGSRHASITALARSLLIAALPIIALSFLLGRWMVTRALRPLSVMGDRAVSLSVERKPRSLGPRSGLAEIDRLADSFDHLLERLDDAMSAERRLTADASHELRTPLTVLSGELDMLLEKTPREAPGTRGLERAAQQIGAMRELVEAILLLHRSGEAGANREAFEIHNLCDIAREALAETLPRYLGRAQDVRLMAPDEILISGHGVLLASALRNLLDNAFKFTRPGDLIEIRVTEDCGHAVLAVNDQGPGVREDERERIFDPFFRGAEAESGTGGFGLGLPILRRVARAHGGDVEVKASDLGGASFALRLPMLRSAPRPFPPA